MDNPCGPLDRSLLVMQDDHISTKIWEGGEREKLDVKQLTANMANWVLKADQISLLDRWGFEGFANPRVVPQDDISLITALVERWRPETNSFHFSFGEMTITLEDVYMILGLPVSGDVLTRAEIQYPKSYWIKQWDDPNLGEQARKDMYDGGIILGKLRDTYGSRPVRDPNVPVDPQVIEQECLLHTRAYVLFIIGGILFPTSSRNSVHPRYLQLLQQPSEIVNYAWGSAVLAHLYRSLGKATHKSSVSFTGCAMLLQLWSYERFLVGRPRIAPFQELTWPRAAAWAEPVLRRRINPHHHTGGYRGDFDSFQLYWLNWTPYSRFYEREEADADDDMWTALYMALGRIPLVSFDIIELQMPDRVMRQFGLMQHIPEEPYDMSYLRTERASNFQRLNHTVIFRSFVDEWYSFLDTGDAIVTEAEYVSVEEYMQWFMRVSKLRIAPFVVHDEGKIKPRDWYNQQFMASAAESGMRLAYEVHKQNPGDWFYNILPDFLGRYDRAFTEWKGLAWSRPSFKKGNEQPPPPPHVLEHPHVGDVREMNIDPSAPASSQQTPVLASHKRAREVDTFGTNSHVQDTTLPVSHKRPREVETGGPPTSLEDPVHVSPPCHVEHVDQVETGGQTTSLKSPETFKPPCSSPGTLGSISAPIAHGFFDIGFSGELPDQLADVLEVDTVTDKILDSQRRGEKKGELKRPLKERKIRWLFNHWWTGTPGQSDGNFIWYDHTGGNKCVTLQLTHAHLWTLAPARWLVDDIVNAYIELLAIREEKLWKSDELRRPALKYFFAASYFMPWAGTECTNLSAPPDSKKTQQELDSMNRFIETYQRQLHGNPIHKCDIAFFPVCTGSHWFLFIVDLCKFKVLLIDPIRDEHPTKGRDIYPLEFYVMEKFLPYMLHILHPDRFRPRKYFRVKEVSNRPKQDGGVDCGVYVCKYIDAILNGLDLGVEQWNPILDVTTFRYRIAHELKCGEARRMPVKSINRRLTGM